MGVARSMTSTLATGIEVLDRKLDGGLPSGKVVLLSASPVSQSELFLYEMASVRPTAYLTTERRASDVRRSLQEAEAPLADIDIYCIDDGDPLMEAQEVLEELRGWGLEGSTLIVDPMQTLERTETSRYLPFMNEVKAWTAESDGLTLLHCLEGRRVPDQRDRTEYLADIVFSLSTQVRGGTLQNELAIPKFRGGEALAEAIDLDLTADVTIDVTRKIA